MAHGPEFSFLRSLSLFDGVDDQTLLAMGRHLVKKKFQAGRHIFYQDEVVEHLFILEMGTVEIYKSDSNGKVVTLWHIEAGRAFCLANLFAGRTFANAQAVSDCMIFCLPRKELNELLTRHPDLALHFISCISSKLAAYSTLLEDFTFKSVQERLVKILLHEKGRELGQAPACSLSQSELACRLGTCREVVSRTLTRLRNEGLIETQSTGKSSRIVIKDEASLRRLIDAD